MPIILPILWTDYSSNPHEVGLTKNGLVVDNRVLYMDVYGWKFECITNGKSLIIKRIDKGACNWTGGGTLFFRAYDADVESVPEFDASKPYTYHGLEHERAPCDIVEVIIDSSVKIIRAWAFKFCRKMKKCTMGDHVMRIEENAFLDCKSLKNIRLSKSLTYIGTNAFSFCCSVDCLFIPPSIEYIKNKAFWQCTGMRILMMPRNIHLEQVGDNIIQDCTSLLEKSKVRYSDINKWLKRRYNHLPLLKICSDPDINAPVIHEFYHNHGAAAFYQTDGNHGLLPLHILSNYNGFVSVDAIMACFEINPAALFAPDIRGLTPLDYLWNDSNVDVIVHVVQDLCIHRRVKSPKIYYSSQKDSI